MKKILYVLVVTALIITIPAQIFAEEDNEKEITSTDGTSSESSIQLEATIVSAYTLKFPKKVDVQQTSTTVDIFAKGDVDGSKKIVIEEKNQGSNVLKDSAELKEDTSLSISFAGGIDGDDIGSDYDTAKDTMTIEHDQLKAGLWSCELPIVIKLEDK